jgi:hypothetical protein
MSNNSTWREIVIAESLYNESETLSELSRKRVTTAIFDVDNTLIRTNITEFYFYLRKRRFSGYFGGTKRLLWLAGFAGIEPISRDELEKIDGGRGIDLFAVIVMVILAVYEIGEAVGEFIYNVTH